MWQKTKTGGKAGFDKLYGWVDKLGAPVNHLSNKLGSEAFWPTTLDKESDKAARILRSFCKDGFYEEEIKTTEDGPKQKQKVLKKIPVEVIKNAKGLAIFTTMRTGLWVSGAGGSGILVGRTEEGSWSPPSGIMLHTAGLGFLVGVDIYDCVVVINTQAALDAFSKIRCTLGGEVSVVAGPLGAGGVLESEVHKRRAPIFTYLKSRGFYAGVQIDGTVVIERTDENERFYGERIGVADILAGKARHPPQHELKTLMQTIKAAQGDTDVDEAFLPSEPPPGDYEVEADGHTFGIPDREDPDPFGVLALENAGLEIREAGTHVRPSSEVFEFRPSPSSPIFSTFSRRSIDNKSISRRSSWRTSTISSLNERATMMTDTSTQTDFDIPATSTPSPKIGTDMNGHTKMSEIPENKSTDEITPEEAPEKPPRPVSGAMTNAMSKKDSNAGADLDDDDATPLATTSEKRESLPRIVTNGVHSRNVSNQSNLSNQSHVDSDDEDDEEEATIVEAPTVHSIQSVQQIQRPQVVNRARMVTVAKPIPPKLPPRNPIRDRKRSLHIGSTEGSPEDETRDQGNSPMTPRRSGSGASNISQRPSLSPLPGQTKPVGQMSMSSETSDVDDGMMKRMGSMKLKGEGEKGEDKKDDVKDEDTEKFESAENTRSPSPNKIPGGW